MLAKDPNTHTFVGAKQGVRPALGDALAACPRQALKRRSADARKSPEAATRISPLLPTEVSAWAPGYAAAVRLNQVTLAVSDLAQSVEFYRRLGLEQIVADERYARFSCPDGDSTLSLEQIDTVPRSATTVYFECEDLDATVSALEATGFGFEHQPTDQPWLWREARLRDPDGNPLCLFRAGENRLNPPWRLRR